jgi:hypothetical protein
LLTVPLSVLALTLSSAKAQVSLDMLLKACKRKTQVTGWDENHKLVKVGEKLDGYCQGFLEGAFLVLVGARSICDKEKQASPDFLPSTVLTYRIETKSRDNDAAKIIEAAFKRAFRCGN